MQRKFLKNPKQLDINIPIIEALVQIPKYAKYLKSLLTNKSKLEEACTETMNERCSTVLLNKLPLKEKDPRSFTIPCQVLEKHKEAEDLAANHLSRFENPHMDVLTEREIAHKFSDEHLMMLKSKFNNDEPWYVNFINYIVEKVVPPNWTFEKRKRCMAGSETLKILAHCHSGPTGGHHSANVTAKKVSEVFDVWGLDFMGPFPQSKGNKYILVDVDYVSNWVEAQALPTNDARVVVKFLRQLFARLGVPKALISDRGTHFCNFQLEKALQRYDDGLENTDRVYTFQTSYEKACHLPVEMEHKVHWALKQCNMDLTLASESHLMQLNKLAKLRDGAYENTRIYKERTNKWHDSRLCGDKDFKVGDQVLLYNSCLKMYLKKLKSKWSSPNIVKIVYPYGAIEITDRDRFSFKVNGKRLKKYYRGNVGKEHDEVLEFEDSVT
nr:hypothetical protein [Tanacetum cinerariifolium]